MTKTKKDESILAYLVHLASAMRILVISNRIVTSVFD